MSLDVLIKFVLIKKKVYADLVIASRKSAKLSVRTPFQEQLINATKTIEEVKDLRKVIYALRIMNFFYRLDYSSCQASISQDFI